VTEGGVDGTGIFHRIPRLDDARLGEILGREVLTLLVSKGSLSREWAERILSGRHTGFNVHSRVRARTKVEAERVGKYMVRPILAKVYEMDPLICRRCGSLAVLMASMSEGR
jgi:hypothetical protein